MIQILRKTHALQALKYTLFSSPQTISAISKRRVHVEKRITDLGYNLPDLDWRQTIFSRVGNVVITVGNPPVWKDGTQVEGKLGQNMNVHEGYDAAKLVALSILANLKHELGDLDKVKRIVKITGFVNCSDHFSEKNSVINGASDLFEQVLQEKEEHPPSIYTAKSLPFNSPLEIEAMIELNKR